MVLSPEHAAAAIQVFLRTIGRVLPPDVVGWLALFAERNWRCGRIQDNLSMVIRNAAAVGAGFEV